MQAIIPPIAVTFDPEVRLTYTSWSIPRSSRRSRTVSTYEGWSVSSR
jgi:hypothetical protein